MQSRCDALFHRTAWHTAAISLTTEFSKLDRLDIEPASHTHTPPHTKLSQSLVLADGLFTKHKSVVHCEYVQGPTQVSAYNATHSCLLQVLPPFVSLELTARLSQRYPLWMVHVQATHSPSTNVRRRPLSAVIDTYNQSLLRPLNDPSYSELRLLNIFLLSQRHPLRPHSPCRPFSLFPSPPLRLPPPPPAACSRPSLPQPAAK